MVLLLLLRVREINWKVCMMETMCDWLGACLLAAALVILVVVVELFSAFLDHLSLLLQRLYAHVLQILL